MLHDFKKTPDKLLCNSLSGVIFYVSIKITFRLIAHEINPNVFIM